MKQMCSFLAVMIITTLVTSINLKNNQEVVEAKGIAEEVIPAEIIKPIEVYEVKTYYDIPLSLEYQDFIRDECEMADVDMELVLAIMQVESNFHSDSVSATNDYGIMQINEINHKKLIKELGIKDFLNPYDCARAGIYMLNHLTWCESETQMLMCYNMGVTGARNAWKKGITETKYSKNVLKAKEEIGGTKYEINVLCN